MKKIKITLDFSKCKTVEDVNKVWKNKEVARIIRIIKQSLTSK